MGGSLSYYYIESPFKFPRRKNAIRVETYIVILFLPLRRTVVFPQDILLFYTILFTFLTEINYILLSLNVRFPKRAEPRPPGNFNPPIASMEA